MMSVLFSEEIQAHFHFRESWERNKSNPAGMLTEAGSTREQRLFLF